MIEKRKMEKSDFQPIAFSTTVHTGEPEGHDFSNVHPGFLASRGVIPNDWTVEESRMQTSSSEIDFENGLRLAGNSNTFHVSQAFDLEAEEQEQKMGTGEELVPPEVTVKYVASVTPDTFKQVRMEWEFLVPNESPADWITRTFFRPELISDEWRRVWTVPILGFFLDELAVVLTFSPKHKSVDGEEEGEILSVTFRIEPMPFRNDGEIIRWLSEWSDHKELVLSHLMPIMNTQDERG